MVGAVGHCILQPMARTNHKFPGYQDRGCLKGSEINSKTSLSTIQKHLCGHYLSFPSFCSGVPSVLGTMHSGAHIVSEGNWTLWDQSY